jgi:putative flippase GtrA
MLSQIPADTASPKPLMERPIVRQFVKFCIVGGISFVIDFTVRWILQFVLKLNGQDLSETFGAWIRERVPNIYGWPKDNKAAFMPITVTLAWSMATLNSFALNRWFTFRIKDPDDKTKQLGRVYLVAFIGLLLNTLISTGLYNIVEGHAKRSLAVASVIASITVAIWSFVGQRYYAFNVHKR